MLEKAKVQQALNEFEGIFELHKAFLVLIREHIDDIEREVMRALVGALEWKTKEMGDWYKKTWDALIKGSPPTDQETSGKFAEGSKKGR